jgi:integrase
MCCPQCQSNRITCQWTPKGTLIGQRIRAIILLGYAGAFRRSELVGLNVDDLQDDANGLIVRLKKKQN